VQQRVAGLLLGAQQQGGQQQMRAV